MSSKISQGFWLNNLPNHHDLRSDLDSMSNYSGEIVDRLEEVAREIDNQVSEIQRYMGEADDAAQYLIQLSENIENLGDAIDRVEDIDTVIDIS